MRLFIMLSIYTTSTFSQEDKVKFALYDGIFIFITMPKPQQTNGQWHIGLGIGLKPKQHE